MQALGDAIDEQVEDLELGLKWTRILGPGA
jgi:hypothetical protein